MARKSAEVSSSSMSNPVSAGAPKNEPAEITPEQRVHMIAVAAYFLAEHRGFVGGDPQEDWSHAEAQIDRMLKDTLH